MRQSLKVRLTVTTIISVVFVLIPHQAAPAGAIVSPGRPERAIPATRYPSVLFNDDFSRYPLALDWTDGSTHGNWTSVFGGFGYNGITSAQSLSGFLIQAATESPRPSTSPRETHAALLTSRPSFGNMDLTVNLRTQQQLRTPVPNNWETGWVLWHFSPGHFYYFIPTPNGWELGKEDPAYPGGQRFLATGNAPSLAMGIWYSVRVRQVANTFSVGVDGALVTSFTDTERPYLSGQLGLYSEDARVQFANVKVMAP